MSDKPKGIVDPWRKVDLLKPAKTPPAYDDDDDASLKKDVLDYDFDADLAIPDRHVIRSAHVCFDVMSTKLTKPEDALDILVTCIAELWNDRTLSRAFADAGIGIRRKNKTWNTPKEGTKVSAIKTDKSVLWIADKTFDQGMLSLGRILKTTLAAPTVRRHGITVMTKA